MSHLVKKALAISLFSLFNFFIFLSIVNAEETQPLIPQMPRVEVKASRIASTTGTVLIDKDLIENLPSKNGSINEIIGIVPGVQYSEGYNSSKNSGEITPPNVSISGSRFYDNNYTIDGMSNNNPVDPQNGDFTDANKLPTHPQSLFLSPKLVEEVKVLNSNIPAEFGGFTGGQVEVKTIDPETDFWGETSYRTTRDAWTKFYISPLDEDAFNNSSTIKYQPKFNKHDGGVILNIPLGFSTGLIASYQQLRAEIPLRHFDNTYTQTRKQENYFIKLAHEISANSRLASTLLYSPGRRKYHSADAVNGLYTIRSKSLTAITNYENDGDFGLFKLTLGYSGKNSERDGTQERFLWDATQPSIDWSSGKEGTFGDLKIGHDEWSIKSDFAFQEFLLGGTTHQVKLGAEVTYSNQHYVRPESDYYNIAVTGAIVCTPDAPACIDGEQYLSRRTKYLAADSTIESTDFAAFVQDSIIWKRLELFPGIRASHSDMTNKLNLAPRFSASFDIFGNQNSILFAGSNRYYSGTLHTFELYKAIRHELQTRAAADNNWNSRPGSTRRGDSTETPYSDEITVGFIQRVFGGELKIQYIDKTTKDEFALSSARETDINNNSYTVYTLNNNGRSEHSSYQISWQRQWPKHFLELNSTWQETTTTHSDYDVILNDDSLSDTIWYEGEEIFKHEIPRKDFNRPVTANLIYSGKLPYGLTFTNIAKFRGPYTYLKYIGRKPSIINSGLNALEFKKSRHHSSLIFDWKISWKIPSIKNQNAILSLDVYNVFNRKTNYGAGADDFELGRQFWAGLTYKF